MTRGTLVAAVLFAGVLAGCARADDGSLNRPDTIRTPTTAAAAPPTESTTTLPTEAPTTTMSPEEFGVALRDKLVSRGLPTRVVDCVVWIATSEASSGSAPTDGRVEAIVMSCETLSTTTVPTTPLPPPPRTTTSHAAAPPSPKCDPNYTPCVPIASDVDCAGGRGNGPAYVTGPVRVIGVDIYGLDRDGDGIGCE
jgi:hypothetical protein